MLSEIVRILLISLLWFFVFVLIVNDQTSAQNSEIIYLEWIDDPTTTAVINWISSPDSDPKLEYRQPGTDWMEANATNNSIPGSTQNRFKATLSNLASGSVYEFRITGNQTIHSF